jgi:two-component system heavy metal sensor histidine kinase CusS
VLAVAIDVDHNTRRLTKLRWLFILTTIVLITTTYTIITLIIRSSFEPIEDLTYQIGKAMPQHPSSSFHIAENFPRELMPLVTNYNKLLERIELTRQRERDFSANAAHELRTPLTGISTTLELALNQSRDAEYYKKSLGKALRISINMQALLERLMRFSKLQSDAYPVHTEPVSVHELLETIWQENHEKASQRGLTAQWQLSPMVDTVNTDKLLFLILLRNLFNNAVSYAVESTTIGIETLHDGGVMRFVITNQTQGIEKEDIEHFFEPFYRNDPARGEQDNHYGIGLTLCREISRVLHGSLSAYLTEDGLLTIEYTFQAS